MATILWRTFLKVSILKLLVLGLLSASSWLYVVAYLEAAYLTQILAGIGSAMAILLAFDQIPAAAINRESDE